MADTGDLALFLQGRQIDDPEVQAGGWLAQLRAALRQRALNGPSGLEMLNQLSLLPLGGRLPRPALAGQPLTLVEWPTHAAVRIGDRTFTGNSHFDAVTAAQRTLGENALAGPNVAADGFLTNQGRYVSREDAGRMLDQLNATRHYRTWLGNEKRGKNGLLSEALELYDPTTGRERP